MSRAGQLQDAIWDILYGYEMGDGEQIHGPLHDLPHDELIKVFRQLEDAVWNIMDPPRDDTPL